MPWGSRHADRQELDTDLGAVGCRAVRVDTDLSDPRGPARVFDEAEAALGPVTALVVVHAYDTGGGVAEVTVEEFDRHMAVNARATLLLIVEFARRFAGSEGRGRIVTFTSGLPLVGSIAYAASKGAVEWITVSAAAELAPRGITVNAVNPGPNDTGWMSEDTRAYIRTSTPLSRLGQPSDAADLVAFLCSDRGGWITGQVLTSDGGWSRLRS
jgi:3-oxoacyl-[acyl-carrier protein] reductase